MTEQDYTEALERCYRYRTDNYPTLGDQLDAAFKARQGDPAPQAAIDAQIAAVKAQYPKPTPPGGAQ